MKVTIVGCTGSVPGPSSPASCYLVRSFDPDLGRNFNLLLDLGSGALGALQSHLSLSEVDAVVLSHLHPDHCLDLCALYVALRHGMPREPRRLPVVGPAGTAERIAAAHDVPEAERSDLSAVFDFDTLVDRISLTLGPFRIMPYRVNHPVEAFGVRVTAAAADSAGSGGVLAYTGDTDSCDALLPLMRGASLVLTDAAAADDSQEARGVHLSPRRAAEAAVAAGGVDRLMLTHIPPWRDPEESRRQASEVWPGVEIAVPGATYDF